jgi:RimJ/RimL family protein N-acetyltransferase
VNHIRLVDVYPCRISTVAFLYDLLLERDPVANISHKKMPAFDDHRKFVESRPYQAWYLVQMDEEPLGAVYLTKDNEIGVFISKSHQGNGYGKKSVYILMSMHPAKRFLANIAPGNERSRAMFEKLGFELIQHTLAKEIKE